MPGRELSGRTVLITGGAGFVGSHLADALVDGNRVRALDDLSSGTRSNLPSGVELVEGDVRDPDVLAEAVEGVDVVFHEAALVSVERSLADPRLSQSINATGTLNVLESARKADARVVVASSAAVYGPPETVPVQESAPKTPTSPYGIDKLTADHYTRLYARRYGLPTVALRYFNAYGPRQTAGDYSGVIRVFLAQARAGEDVTVHGEGSQTRDFVHVSDVVRANLLAASTSHTGEAFNVGTGRSVTVRELAERVREATGSRSAVVHTEPRPGDIDRSRADISKAREKLGYEPEVTLDAGLDELVERGDEVADPLR